MKSIHGYELTQWLGSGGMGEVYQAFHPATGRTVALKLLNRPEFWERFRNEARIQATVHHPHIAELYEFFTENEVSCIVMEFVEGTPLDQVIRRQGALSEDMALSLLGQAASAVAYLHSRGICHRDLKASNLKISRTATAKLLDFGIAREGQSPRLTREGHLVGTARCMAPEQFEGLGGPPADCWALGVMFYEMLTGHAPFDGRTGQEIAQNVKRGKYLLPSVLKPEVSKNSERLLARLLTVSPDRRLSAEGLLASLQNPSLLNEPDWLGTVRKWVGRR